MLNRQQVIEEFKKRLGWDISKKLIVKTFDHKDNPIAPERYCYKVYFDNPFNGKRMAMALWPQTVGVQSL